MNKEKKDKKEKELEDITFTDGDGNFRVNGEILIKAENMHY